MTAKKTYDQKLSWLRKNHIVLKKEKISQSTVNRLYSFYQRNPLSTPRNLAYGLPKRIEKTLERQQSFRTPKGKITAKEYVQNFDEITQKDLEKQLPPAVVSSTFNKYYSKVKHVRDEFIYIIRPPITATASTMNRAIKEANVRVMPDIHSIISLTWQKRKNLYANHDFGALIYYNTNNLETADGSANPSGWIRVGWSHADDPHFFERGIVDAIATAFNVVNSASASKKTSVEIYRIDIYISTKSKATPIDMLRVDG